ncbi:hypothetical protein TRFO_06183 [Tritrichomonas foetus]|uniref:Leucine Rich Repeat family protein n=1 Tax=Tritrichomonas foetus TaxID=1144522 RepID=A0A1J4K5J7_9EUKA|nr:hypothetical protein TRFO_06183 [Tritrichomonas foetus]|eukprot:OHT04749.1 hypothetical protein TRFO_06183 [Tritrichomonas foetus]
MISQAIVEYGTVGAFHTDNIFELSENCNPDDVHSFEAQVDTTESSLTFIGDRFPNLRKLRLNNSIIPNVRDIGCSFVGLKFLSLARCGISDLSGISTLSSTLEELYLAFNNITDVADLLGMDSLKVLDLEDNQISDLSNIEFLTCCSGLKSLTLAGNPCVDDPEEYRTKVAKLVPNLIYLDEKRLKPKLPKKKGYDNNPRNCLSIVNEKVNDASFPIRPPTAEKVEKKKKLSRETKGREPIQEPVPQIREPINSSIREPGKSPIKDAAPSETSFKIQEPSMPPRPLKEKTVKIVEPKDDQEPYENDDEVIITEMLDDMIEDRPPTSRGNYENQFFKDKMEVPPRNRTSKGLKYRPHVITPRVRRIPGRCVSAARK